MSLIGRELKGIRILERIGAGCMGVVYRGCVVHSGRYLTAGMEVAVKVLHPHLGSDADALARFKLEAGLGLSLNHPGISTIYRVGSARVEGDSIHFLVQEFVRGSTLKDLIREAGPLNDRFLRELALQAAEALAHIHERGIVHRDLKPENIFLSEGGRLKLVDFGFSLVERRLRSGSDPSGAFFGSVAYAAPERFGRGRAGKASDLYALGVILYELATGENPFLGEDLESTIARHLEATPEEPRRRNHSLSLFMNRVIMALLEKKPAARLHPSQRLARILSEGERSAWWRSQDPGAFTGPVSFRRQQLNVARWTPVFGRERPLARLLELADAALGPGGGLRAVCLMGEAGSGKTRLVDHLLEEMDRTFRPGRVIVVEGAQSEVKIPYHPLISALQSAFDLRCMEGAALLEALGRRKKKLLPGRMHWINVFLDPLVPAEAEEDGLPPPLVPDLAGRLFGELFAAMARESPIVLVVENVLRADAPSFRVILDLLPALAASRAFVLFTLRKEEAREEAGDGRGGRFEELLQAMARWNGRHVIHLKRLDPPAFHAMLRSFGLSDRWVKGALGERFYRITEGNPYFAAEMTRLILREGLEEAGADADPSGLSRLIPGSIRDVFYRRLFQVSPQERKFLDFAAVIGMRFQVEEVVEGLGLEFGEAARVVSRLQNRFSLIRPSGGAFRFDHVLLREMLYRTIPVEVRARYHRRAGEYLDRAAAQRPLAGWEHYKAFVHLARGGDPRRALVHFKPAFDYLRRRHFHERAFQVVETALSLMERLHSRGEEADLLMLFEARLRQAEVAGFLGEVRVQYRALGAAFRTARSLGDPAREALVRLRLGQYYLAASRFFSALNLTQGALERMRRLGDPAGESDALHTLAAVLKGLGEVDEAMRLLQACIDLRVKTRDRAGQAAVLVDLGAAFLEAGRIDEADRIFEDARRIFQQLNDVRGDAFALLGMARVSMERRRFKTAEAILVRARALAVEVGDGALEADIAGSLGMLYLYLGKAKAAQCLEEALNLCRSLRDPVRRARVHEMRARWLLHPDNPEGSADRALEEARRALAILRKIEAPPVARFSALETLARVFAARDRRRSALALLRKARRLARDEGILPERARRVENLYRALAHPRTAPSGVDLLFRREAGARFL